MEELTLVPPDGGWGWFVLFGATLINVLVPGTVKSFGVLFVEFLEVFEATPSAAAWIPALCYFLYSSLGPVSSILSIKYSYRSVAFAGGTSAALGMILSFFSQSIVHLYLSYGLLVGIGAGLSFPPTVYIVSSYFVKRRGIANGICMSGSAFGSIVLPPLLRVFLETYGYRGAVLLMGGITLHCWISALLYDPVEKHMVKIPKTSLDENNEDIDFFPEKPKFMISTEDNTSSLYQLDENDAFLENSNVLNNTFVRSASSAAVPNYKGCGGRECKISTSSTRNELSRVRSGGNRYQLAGSTTLYSVPETSNTTMKVSLHSNLSGSKMLKSSVPPQRSSSTSSFHYISTPYHGSTLTLSPEIIASTFSLKSGRDIQKQGDKQDQSFKTPKLFDVSIFKDPLYLVILISNSTNAICYTNFIILLPSYAHTIGYDKNKAALLLSIVSALDVVGRIGGSALSDITHFQKYWYYVCGLLFSGVSLTLLPLSPTYSTISTFCATFGLFSGTYVGITAVIMADLLGTEKLQSSYGTSLFINGILQLIGPPICGVWFQSIQTYIPIFCILGIIQIAGASIWCIVPFLKKEQSIPGKELNVRRSP